MQWVKGLKSEKKLHTGVAFVQKTAFKWWFYSSFIEITYYICTERIYR